MSSSAANFSSVQALNREVKIIGGSFVVDDTGNTATKVQGLGWDVVRLAAGVYAVDLEDSYPSMLAAVASVQKSVAADLVAQIRSHDVKATATASLVNQGITYTSNQSGRVGNEISVELIDPSANDEPLAVSVVGDAIEVTLATDSLGAITTTATQLVAALNALSSVTNLVSVSGSGAIALSDIAATNLSGGANRGMILAILAGTTPTEADMTIQINMLLRNSEVL
jgi:hypothetical protein